MPRLDEAYQGIREATHMFITLGTAWCYRHTATEMVVANCHKVAQNQFSKQLLPIDRIEKSLQNMLQLLARENANANITITVSPVRHLKDGFVENQRSKAHLIAAVHNTLKKPDLEAQTTYFPAYEIMMDELRDYRFYDDDLVHPNRMALHYIWEKFAAAAIFSPCARYYGQSRCRSKGTSAPAFQCSIRGAHTLCRLARQENCVSSTRISPYEIRRMRKVFFGVIATLAVVFLFRSCAKGPP